MIAEKKAQSKSRLDINRLLGSRIPAGQNEPESSGDSTLSD